MKYLILALAIGLVSCDDRANPKRKEETIDGYSVIIIDSCQYIRQYNTTYMGYNVTTFCHKGNCTNHKTK